MLVIALLTIVKLMCFSVLVCSLLVYIAYI
jgi:hypothetical protein